MYRPISSASRSLVEAPALDVRAHLGVEEPPVVEQLGECLLGGDLQVMPGRAFVEGQRLVLVAEALPRVNGQVVVALAQSP
jgi:hypothetical protein